MPSHQPSAWGQWADKGQNRRYLRVTAEPIDGSDEPTLAYLVDCPRRGRIAIDVCVACPEGGRLRYRGARGPVAVECKYVSAKAPRLVVRRYAGDALERSVSELLLGAARFCVTPGLGLNQVATFFRLRALRQVPVVNELRRPVGILSHADIVRASGEREPGRVLTVAQAMRPIRHTLPASASVLQALSLIWENRLDALVLISASGEAAGIVGEFELLQQIDV